MKYHLTSSDRKLIQDTVTGFLRTRYKPVPQRRRRVKPGGGGIKGHYQIIRGTVDSGVVSVMVGGTTYHYVEIINSLPFEQYSLYPQEDQYGKVKVSLPIDETPEVGETLWAAYRSQVIPHPTVPVDWYKLPVGGSSPPLRRFEILTGKASYVDNVACMWLDFNEEMVGDPDYDWEIVWDPEGLFSGQPEGYIGYERGFRGVALLRTDLAQEYTQEPRWEIVEMEGWARWVVCKYEAGEIINVDPRKQVDWMSFQAVSPITDHYECRIPQEVEEPIRWLEDTTSPMVKPVVGDTVLLMLIDADPATEVYGDGWTWEPQYYPVAVLDRTAVVRVKAENLSDPAGYPVYPFHDVFYGEATNTVETTVGDTEYDTPCWITDLSEPSYLPNKEPYIGRLVGMFDPFPGTENSDNRPRYVIKSAATGTGAGGVVVHIDEDIDGITEDPDLEQNGLDIFCYERVSLDLKYYVPAVEGDTGYEAGKVKMILAVDDSYGSDSGDYLTIPVFYDDGADFKVGEYVRKDYPDYPESEVFPPDGTGTYEVPPEGFLNCKWRGIAVPDDNGGWVLVTAMCKRIPPPPLTENVGS